MSIALFPELETDAGGAASATRSQAPTVDAPAPLPAGRQVELSSVPTGSALVRQRPLRDGQEPWFDWSANPYRGCEIGCGYCYARSYHALAGPGFPGHEDPREFETEIYVKDGFATALRRNLRRVKPGQHIAFGTATDPYQPVESREGVMRAALRELLTVDGLRISITTKSALVGRDAELLGRLAERHAVGVNMTITTPDERLARFLEPRAPVPRKRLSAIAKLRRHGVEAGVFLMPLLPGITDLDADLERLMDRAADAGARWLCASVLFLRGPSRTHFLRAIRRAYPRVAARYDWWTRSRSRLPKDVRNEVMSRVRSMATRHGLPASPDLAPPQPVRTSRQTTFAFSEAG